MNECPLCNLDARVRRDIEIKIHRQEITHIYAEQKHGWEVGVVARHMDEHIDYTPAEEAAVESLRVESIDTLNTAESLLQRMMGWLDELEEQKEVEGISVELVGSFTRLVSECNRSLKLVGQLKKEIGTESQMFLADQRMQMLSRILVEVLSPHPMLLDEVELKMNTLKAPTYVEVGE
jgi:hypothetical protein